MTCRKFLISGRVQGVFFRQSTRSKALELGLTGHAVNLDDGRVEVLACGAEDAVEQLSEWLKHGPEQASVGQVSCTEADEQEAPDGFVTA
ncbi:MAG: acylphosphatase [Wenzhouxiangellaceae bacterium]|nr:acylphosphatase [Wenzhouxiangellaceae bacterium]